VDGLRKALIVANDEYEHEGLKHLRAPAADAEALDSFPGGRLGGGRDRAVITASSAMEYAFEGDQLADDHSQRPSVFTSALVEGLATGDADRDEDGWVSLNELYDYVFDRVREQNPLQTPSRDVEMQGELYLARRSRPVTRPAQLPAELQEVIDHPLAGVRAGAVQELTRLLPGRHAGQALAVRMALERLAQDDSRTVAAAAAAALAAIDSDKGSAPIGVRAPAHREPPAAPEEAPPAEAATTITPPAPPTSAVGSGRVGRGGWVAARLGRVGRGRWVAAVLAVAVVATVAVLATIRPWAAGCSFADGFTGDEVDAGWERANISGGGLAVAGGSLEMSANLRAAGTWLR